MKPHILILLLVVAPSSSLFAQGTALHLGFNSSTSKYISSSPAAESLNQSLSSKPGWQIGVSHDFPISKTFSLEPRLLFISRGFKTNVAGPIAPSNSDTRISTWYYLNVPLHFKANWNIGKTKFYVGLGPYLDIGLFTMLNIDGHKSRYTFDDWDMKTFTFGMSTVLGVEFDRFSVEAFYHHGLSSIEPTDRMKRVNRSKGLSIGYRLFK